MDRTIWTFDLTYDQLNRVQEQVYRSADPFFRIIHVLSDDSNHREDHYICLVQCRAETATMLYLL
jgi:hypothetical protein